jgi:NAD(P)-dependent dehydrogenase (short-subunit alcohol dehydrogenase family)
MTELPAGYAPSPDLLQGRTVLVTGAGDGLGRATSLLCAQAGAMLILAGRSVARLEAVYDAIVKGGGEQPAIYPLDLSGATWGDYEQLASTVEREFGLLHGVVHCAAHFKGFAPLATAEPKDWLESLQVNLTAAFALTRHCLPLLERTGDASVVFVSDDCGRQAKAYAGPYGVAKFALEGMVQGWSQELEAAGRVRMNTLDPGPMDTALRRRGYTSRGDARDPAHAAAAVAWLLGRDSAGVNGRALSLRR